MFRFLFEKVNVAVPDPNIFFAVSVAEAATVNPKSTKTLLDNGLSTFLIKGRPVFNNGPRSLPKNPHNCVILDN